MLLFKWNMLVQFVILVFNEKYPSDSRFEDNTMSKKYTYIVQAVYVEKPFSKCETCYKKFAFNGHFAYFHTQKRN